MNIKQVYTRYPPTQEAAGIFEYCPFCGVRTEWVQEGPSARAACPSCEFVQYRNPAPTVSAIVVDGDRVLLGRRGREPGRGTWSLPSGYIEFEDDFLRTAIREVDEETGLQVALVSIVNVVSSFVSPQFHFLHLFLLARVISGELRAGDDLEAVAWFPLRGPLPQMGFEEDVDAIRLVADGFVGLPVDARHASPALGV